MTQEQIQEARRKILGSYTVEFAYYFPQAVALPLGILDDFLSITTKRNGNAM